VLDPIEVCEGFVRLDGALADDLSVVNSARVSFAQHSETLGERETGLINFLMRERHGTPFEHNAFRFHVKCPIFVAREWFRHRIGSFNEHSARYSEMPAEAYVPADDAWRRQVGKPGAYTFEPMPAEDADELTAVLEGLYAESFGVYRSLLERGVAKEIARLVLPMGTYTQFYWTVNARSLMNFLSLRTSEHAQREIREYAEAVQALFAGQMPVTYAAWVENDRKAP
jgi:thymidylate synthase (FAD)